MKKFVALFAFLVAFSISANAQDQKTIDIAAKKDVSSLTEYLGLDETTQENFFKLFQMKHEILTDASLTQERKDEMSRQVGLKVMATLSSAQMAKLDANPDLLQAVKGPSEKMGLNKK